MSLFNNTGNCGELNEPLQNEMVLHIINSITIEPGIHGVVFDDETECADLEKNLELIKYLTKLNFVFVNNCKIIRAAQMHVGHD